jgi:cytochrome c-type biogenesis protein CcmH/NrfG
LAIARRNQVLSRPLPGARHALGGGSALSVVEGITGAPLNSYYLGLVILIGILGARFAVGRWRLMRFRRLWAEAQESVRDNNWVAAEAALRRCARMMPIAGPVHRLLGGVLARRGKLSEAEKCIRLGAELEPKNPAGFLDLGFLLMSQGPERVEQAIDAFATAVACAPNLRETLAKEPRLEALRRHERFQKLVDAKR